MAKMVFMKTTLTRLTHACALLAAACSGSEPSTPAADVGSQQDVEASPDTDAQADAPPSDTTTSAPPDTATTAPDSEPSDTVVTAPDSEPSDTATTAPDSEPSDTATTAPDSEPSDTATTAPDSATPSDADATEDAGALPTMTTITLFPGDGPQSPYLQLTSGGDTDVEVVTVGASSSSAVRSGNGASLGSDNAIPDDYIQVDIASAALFQGWPTPSVLLEIEYLDEGTDGFVVEYDGSGGVFTRSHLVYKTDTRRLKTASFLIKDGYFGDRGNNADLRIDDLVDGAETVHRISLTLLPVPTVTNIDECGADPLDEVPDSDAIQRCIDRMADGDTLLFSSAAGRAGYRGYLVDKTLFAVTRSDGGRFLTFAATDPADPALLAATRDLAGFVLRLMARSAVHQSGRIDHITFTSLHIDGNRGERVCYGEDQVGNGVDDNWGSWLAGECNEHGDPWCNPGSVALAAGWNIFAQDHEAEPDRWSNDIVAEGLRVTNTECGTAFAVEGAGGFIVGCTIDTAGDHVHADGCASTDPDADGLGDWSDGMTIIGPAHQIIGNTIRDPSDVGIVFFGGRETVIRDNELRVTAGNHGAFAAIAVHPWAFGDVGAMQVVDNRVESDGDSTCGGMHAGINLGVHMWGNGCDGPTPTAVGNPGCDEEAEPPMGSLCPESGRCQKWAHVPAVETLVLRGNTVAGAHVNFLVEGVDGSIDDQGNISVGPRSTDWQGARDCGGISWEATDRIAHHPALEGWSDVRVHCER